MKTMESAWINEIFKLAGALIAGGVIRELIIKRRYKNMDNANVEEKLATVRKIEADIDISLHSEGMKLVQALRSQIETMNTYHHEVQADLDREKKRNQEAQRRIEQLQESLNKEMERCREMTIEIEQLRIKVEQYERSRRGPI